MGSSSPDSGKLRPLWGQVTPYPSMSTQNNLFEVSGEYLSSSYSAVEEVTSGHTDIELSLQTRIKVCVYTCVCVYIEHVPPFSY